MQIKFHSFLIACLTALGLSFGAPSFCMADEFTPNYTPIPSSASEPTELSAGSSGLSTQDNPQDNKPQKQVWASRASEVLMNALSLTGIPYKYGGTSPETGFDCSGFVGYVFKQALRLHLPRTALALSKIGKPIAKHELQPGDLVFFNTLRSTFSHVGIYIGENRFIHSPSKGGVVRVESLQTGYWEQRYSGAQRVEEQSAQAD